MDSRVGAATPVIRCGACLRRLDPADLAACIEQWFIDIGREIGKHVAIDGKTIGDSFDKAAHPQSAASRVRRIL